MVRVMLSCCPVMTVMTPVTASSSQQYSAGRGDVKLNLHLSCSRHPGHLHTLLFSGDDIDCSMSPSPPPAILRTNIFLTTTNNIVHHFGQFHNIFNVERSEVLEVGILVIFWWALLHSVCAGHYQLLPCRLASDCPRHHQPPLTVSDFTTFQLPTIIIAHCSQSQ